MPGRDRRADNELPPPLPPETRTIGQLVAESVRFYGRRFWRGLALGFSPAVLVVVLADAARPVWFIVMWTVGALLLSGSYVFAAALVADVDLTRRTFVRALAVAVAVFLPFPLLVSLFIIPGLLWFALLGLAVPASVIEGLGFRASLGRGLELARADFVHALGSLTTLAVTAFLTQGVLFFLLRGQGDATTRAAAFLASLVISPVVFIGAAMLYVDQAARVRKGVPTGSARAGAEEPSTGS